MTSRDKGPWRCSPPLDPAPAVCKWILRYENQLPFFTIEVEFAPLLFALTFVLERSSSKKPTIAASAALDMFQRGN